MKQLRSWHWSTLKVISESMSALARTSERDCRTRTTSENCTASESWTRTKFGYDNIYELLSVTQAVDDGELYLRSRGQPTDQLGKRAWSYNTSNELNSRPDASYAFDYNGNTIVKTTAPGAPHTPGITRTYDQRDSAGSGGTVSFRYDPSVAASISRPPAAPASSPTTMTTSWKKQCGRRNGGSLHPRPAVDEPLAMLRSSTTSYFQADGMGRSRRSAAPREHWRISMVTTVSATLWPRPAILSTASDTRDANSTQKLASITTADTMTCNPAGSFRRIHIVGPPGSISTGM